MFTGKELNVLKALVEGENIETKQCRNNQTAEVIDCYQDTLSGISSKLSAMKMEEISIW